MRKLIKGMFKYIVYSDRINYDRNTFIESRETLCIMLALLGISN